MHTLFLRISLIICLSMILLTSHAQNEKAYVEKQFVIIKSTPHYEEALETAKSAATNLKFKLDLRELKKKKNGGLTWSRQICEEEWDEFPCYVARGRYDDGNYVSIEYSDGYQDFRKGYYIVIIAGNEEGSPAIQTALTEAKKIYRDAYAKTTKVYVGCMH